MESGLLALRRGGDSVWLPVRPIWSAWSQDDPIFSGVILRCDRLYPDGCETHMLIGPFVWASWIGIGTGAVAAFAVTLVGMALGRLDMSLARVRGVAGALFVYVASISMLVLFTGIPYWFYVLLAIFIVGLRSR